MSSESYAQVFPLVQKISGEFGLKEVFEQNPSLMEKDRHCIARCLNKMEKEGIIKLLSPRNSGKTRRFQVVPKL